MNKCKRVYLLKKCIVRKNSKRETSEKIVRADQHFLLKLNYYK